MTPASTSGYNSSVNIKLGLNKAITGRGASQIMGTRDGTKDNRDIAAKSMLAGGTQQSFSHAVLPPIRYN